VDAVVDDAAVDVVDPGTSIGATVDDGALAAGLVAIGEIEEPAGLAAPTFEAVDAAAEFVEFHPFMASVTYGLY